MQAPTYLTMTAPGQAASVPLPEAKPARIYAMPSIPAEQPRVQTGLALVPSVAAQQIVLEDIPALSRFLAREFGWNHDAAFLAPVVWYRRQVGEDICTESMAMVLKYQTMRVCRRVEQDARQAWAERVQGGAAVAEAAQAEAQPDAGLDSRRGEDAVLSQWLATEAVRAQGVEVGSLVMLVAGILLGLCCTYIADRFDPQQLRQDQMDYPVMAAPRTVAGTAVPR